MKHKYLYKKNSLVMKSVCNLKFTSYELSISPDNKKVVFNFVSEKSGKFMVLLFWLRAVM